MAQIGRLAGAILAETEGRFYLIGDCKVPCDFAALGFMPPPPERNVLAQPYIGLEALRPFNWSGTLFSGQLEGEALAQRLVDSFLIFRNGSVSERLWRYVQSQSRQDRAGAYDVNWLLQIPHGVWEMVRDQILRCS